MGAAHVHPGRAPRLFAAIAVAVVWNVAGGGCSSTTKGTGGADAGSDAEGEAGTCPDSQPGAGTECSGEFPYCPYDCGTTYCSCASGFWQCSPVLHGEGGACEAVDGTPAPKEGDPCAQACGPFVGDTCSFACPGGGSVGATCGASGWQLLGACPDAG